MVCGILLSRKHLDISIQEKYWYRSIVHIKPTAQKRTDRIVLASPARTSYHLVKFWALYPAGHRVSEPEFFPIADIGHLGLWGGRGEERIAKINTISLAVRLAGNNHANMMGSAMVSRFLSDSRYWREVRGEFYFIISGPDGKLRASPYKFCSIDRAQWPDEHQSPPAWILGPKSDQWEPEALGLEWAFLQWRGGSRAGL